MPIRVSNHVSLGNTPTDNTHSLIHIIKTHVNSHGWLGYVIYGGLSWANDSDKFLPVQVTSTEILGGGSSPSRELAIPVYPPLFIYLSWFTWALLSGDITWKPFTRPLKIWIRGILLSSRAWCYVCVCFRTVGPRLCLHLQCWFRHMLWPPRRLDVLHEESTAQKTSHM